MKRILLPISFSKSSENALLQASQIFPKAILCLAHIFPSQQFNRKYDFGASNYKDGITEKLKTLGKKYSATNKVLSYISASGVVSEFVAQQSKNYDLLIMSRKSHVSKKHGYLSEKKLYITTRAKCPVLILPIRDKPFKFENCGQVWHINRHPSEPEYVRKWNRFFSIKQNLIEEKFLSQSSFISSFWRNIVKYESTHNSKLLQIIDRAHASEAIDLIILVDNDHSLFTKFFMSDTVKLFCKYDIPLLILPPQK